MALIKVGLGSIVNETESVPTKVNAYGKYFSQKDRALATIVLSVDPSLLYKIGYYVDPTNVRKKN